ncbi:oxygen-regulated protein 1-like [Chanos chanos]|uniref:Oxygen-regulated protein 1-like n=1 Tax=Chanos chanos TaxID=29144 RepID=A0A6J2VSW3_CHACN|nr:oxygen-regulated protein 1 [Chanos chanos]
MSDVPAPRKAPPQTQSSGSGHTLMTSRQPYLSDTISSKRVCFYKSGDAKFSGLPVIINNRTFRTFESLLDSLSKRVPLPFGVRTITTPRGHTTVQSLDQLENGQSYICSDRRTVKPIDLERARRKPRPWYHARPVSSRRRALQLARQKQNSGRGARNARKNERTLLHTPRRLVVFRNGDPQERHTLLLQKRTTHSFEALLDHVSQVMRFHVVKLYTPDGRRVDGLPALILCSGVLVAAGWEPFKNGNYDTQRPSELTWLPAKSMGNKRFKQTVPRKKKSMSSGTKSRNFSPSSERFLINQLHRSVAGSMYDTGSVELEHGQTLESVAETETLTCPDAEGEGDGHVLPDDDIEKSFRVNQDGSMTVEMRVRLTIKEEETIHWTTTVSRSSVASQVKADCDSLSNLHEQSPDLRSLPNNGPVPLEVEHNSHAKENTDPLPLENGIVNEEKEIGGGKPNAQVVEPLSPLPTSPGFHAFREKQESIENIRRLTELEIQENVVGSYSYREETCTGEVVEEYCMLRQSSSRPVPKPRSSLPSEINNNNSSSSTHLQSSSYTSAEVLHLQDSGEEVRETVLHIYEQQSCQENFFANTQLCLQGVTTSSSRHSRPASSDTVFPASSDKTFRSTSEDWESENKISSGNELLSDRESVSQAQVVTVSPAAEENSRENLAVLSSEPPKRRKPVRVIIKKSRIIRNVIPERKRKEGKVHLFKDVKKGRPDILNPAKPVKPLEHLRTKAVQKWLKSKNQSVINKHRGVSVRTSAMPNNSTQVKNKNLNKLSVVREQNTSEMTSNSGDSFNFKVGEGAAPPKRDLLAAFHNKSTLTRQTSMHDDWEHEQDTKEPTEALSLGAVHSSSSVINEYVELWLQKSRPDPMCDLEEEPQSNVELRQNATFHIGSDQASSPEVSEITLDQGSGEFLGQESTPDKTPLPRNMTLKRAPLPETIISKEISFANGTDWKQIKSPESTALAKTQLQSQPSVENIPKNNTLAKASLFNSKPLEKTPLPRKVNLVKKQTPKNVSGTTVPVSSDMSNERASASTEVVKEPCDSLQNELSEPEKMENVKQITKDTQRAEIPTEKPMCPVDEFYTVRMANELDMRPVLEQLCSSIQSLRKTTHRKRRSCLEKSNSLPDFSSHVASTFGSSSRVLLAFLSVMALKDALSGLDTDWEKTSSMSCSEALRMIQSLKEVAAIEDADLLRASLNDLQKSTSSHLLQSWKGFQDLSCKARSRSVTPDSTRSEVLSGSTPDEKQAIQELMGELGVPEKVRKELAALSGAEEEQMKRNQTEHSEDITVSDPKVNVNGLIESLQREDTVSFCDSVLEEDVNIYVKSVIEKAINTHLDASDSYEKVSARDMLPTWSATEKEREVIRHEGEQSEEKEEFCHIKCLEPKQGNFTPVPDIFVDTPTSDSNLEMESMASGSIEVQHQGTKEETGKKRVEERELYEERYSEEVEDGVMDEKPSSVESFSRSKEKLSASEEEKSSLEDDEKSCDEELMSFVDDICDEDQRCSLQNAEYGDSVDQEGREIWAYSDEGQSGQTSSQTKEQLVCKSDSVEKQTSSATWQPNFIQDPVIHNAEEVNIKEQCSSMEEQSSYEEKHSSSEEGPVILEEPECYKAYQDRYEEQQKYCLEDPAKHEETTGDLAGERKSSVAQLISCLENQAKSGQSKASHATEKSSTKLFGHIDPPEVSDVDDLTNVSHISNEQVKIEEFIHVKSKQNNGSAEVSKQSPKIIRTTQSTPMPITSPPLPSSLAFSYDSHGTSVREPEGNVQINRVKSIREMFLAKSSTEGHYGKKKLARPNISDLSDNRPGTSESGEHQSQTSPDVSSGEDDTRKLAIAKGYVRRTIERLYGRGNSNGSDSEGKRPTSASKSKRRENPGKSKVSSLASFHEARTRVIPDLSYFKATSTFDEYEEPSQCISLNPDMNNSDTVLTDKGLCPLTETKLIDKAPPELTETAQKGVDDKKEDAPYSFFGSVSPHSTLSSTEVEDPSGPPGSKFTYFNMPNANDSELEQEDQCVDTTERKSEVKAKSPIESPRAWAEKNGSLPAFIPSELKRIDNKVHPLVEDNSSLVPVVTQPTKGQSAQTSVARHPAEPDALEMLYLMCGQHCPIL